MFCGSRATVCVSGGLEMRKVSLSGGRAGRVMIFLARSILARGHPDRAQDTPPLWGPWRPTSELKPCGYLNQCIWEVVVGSGGGGGDRLSSEKLAEVGRGAMDGGGGESARRWHGKMKSTSPSRSKVKDQPVLETPRLSLACVKRMPSALPSPPS